MNNPYDRLIINCYTRRARKSAVETILSNCNKLEAEAIPTVTFLWNEDENIGCSFFGKYVHECEFDIDKNGTRTNAHNLSRLLENIRRKTVEDGKRAFVVDIGIFERDSTEMPIPLFCHRLKELADELDVKIMVFFFVRANENAPIYISAPGGSQPIEEVFATADYDYERIESLKEIVEIPDPNFKRYLVKNFDKDGDGEISVVEALMVTRIFCKDKKISSLKGIEAFENLVQLTCSFNDLCDLDISQLNELIYLDCQHNRLTYLDLSGNKLLRICWCGYNSIEKLDVSKNSELYKLNCQNNVLKTLNVRRNKKLFRLDCANNKLTSLNLTKNPELKQLRCFRNRLRKLDVSKNPLLQYLIASENKLASLDTSLNPDLISLFCAMNALNSLDTSKNRKLRYLSCHDNNLTSLNLQYFGKNLPR